jgi:diaminopimelate decarboxylase
LDHRAQLREAFARWPWLTALHVHVGSQGCEIDLLTQGVRKTVDLALEIEAELGSGRVACIDIGGGLPATYRPEERAPSFQEYAAALRSAVPELFDGRWQLVTEFGRALWAGTACAVSRVEYTKTAGGKRIAVNHLGADMFVRPAYLPETWRHEVSVLDPRGRRKQGPLIEQDIAGPLCFSGDFIAKDRQLPLIEQDDHVLIRDVGAYTLSMWSRYNSRLSPAVFGYSSLLEELELLRRVETVDDVCRFWD